MKPAITPTFTKASAAWLWMAEQYEQRTEFSLRWGEDDPTKARGVCVALIRLEANDCITGELYMSMSDAWENCRPTESHEDYWWSRGDFESRAFACGLMAAMAEAEGQ